MKILIKQNVRDAIIMGYMGSTFAEKRINYEGWGNVPKERFNYENKIAPFAGKWMEVDTKFLFHTSFNGILDDGSIIHVDIRLVDKVDILPEFESFEQYEKAVHERYEKDWTGSKPSMKYIVNMIIKP